MPRPRALRAAAAAGWVLLLAAVGCDRSTAGTDMPATAAHRPTASGEPTTAQPLPRVTVHRTGGIAGVDQRLVVRPDGGWSWEPGAPGRAGAGGSTGRLDDRTRSELARLAADPHLSAQDARRPGPPRCTDAFHYTVTAGASAVSWYACGDPPPRVAGAVVALLAAATPL